MAGPGNTTETKGSSKTSPKENIERKVVSAPRIDVVIGVVYVGYMVETGVVGKLPLGHAGALLIRGSDGLSRYYEYGRYDAAQFGIVRRKGVPNATIGPDGVPTLDSLKAILQSMSTNSGQGCPIEGIYLAVERGYDLGVAYAEQRLKQNGDPNRTKYSIRGHNCVTFMEDVVRSVGKWAHWSLLHDPGSCIFDLQMQYRDVHYSPKSGTVEIDW